MRMHRCAEIGCRELIKPGWTYCQPHYEARMKKYVHAKQANADRNAQTLRGQYELSQATKEYDSTRRQELHDGFYNTKQWKKISAYVKSRDGYADAINGRLWDDGELIVDHIIPRRLLPKGEQLDTSNLWLLTRAQHNHKTSVEKKLSENVLNHASCDWWRNVLREKPQERV